MRAVVVAGSDLSHELDQKALAADLIVAVDAGADALARADVVPNLFVGDMDSVTVETRATMEDNGVETVLLSTTKDETDLEHALRLVVERGAQQVVVFAALGGPRLDHLLGNVLLLASPWLSGIEVRLVDEEHEMLLAGGDMELNGQAGDLISLLPLTAQVDDVSTEGLLYPLKRETLTRSSTRSLSNVMTDSQGRVRHGAGALLLVHYRGRHA